MSSSIVHLDTIRIRREAFAESSIRVTIDCGFRHTKVTYVSRDTHDDADPILLRCATFPTEDLNAGLELIKQEVQLPPEASVQVTGVATKSCCYRIKEVLGWEKTVVARTSSVGLGAFLLISHCDAKDVFFPKPEFRSWLIESEMFEDLMKSTKEKIVEFHEPFPALVVLENGLVRVEKDGSSSPVSRTRFSGQVFLGMAHALVGTADYDELMSLAESGNCLKVDMTMRDLITDDPDIAYAKADPDMPAFSFGKASSKSWDKSSCRREDLAASLLRFMAANISMQICSGIVSTGLNKVYFANDFFRHVQIRKLVNEALTAIPTGFKTYIEFLKVGHCRALAAMVAPAEESA